jgi:hypothetical protein
VVGSAQTLKLKHGLKHGLKKGLKKGFSLQHPEGLLKSLFQTQRCVIKHIFGCARDVAGQFDGGLQGQFSEQQFQGAQTAGI